MARASEISQKHLGTGSFSRVHGFTRLSNRDIALLLAVLTVTLLLVTARDTGLTWDEPIYIEASESYIAWFRELFADPIHAFKGQVIQAYWEINHEHPPFDKLLSGFMWVSFRSVVDDLTAHRLGNMLLSGALIALLYGMVAQGFGRVAGLAAAVSLLTLPRFFFHAHLAALDVPTSATIFLVAYLYWRTVHLPGLKWGIWLGIAFGIALATKINAVIMVPIVLGIWTILFHRRREILLRFVLMGAIGIVVWILHWPWLFHATLTRIIGYLDFMTINHYPIEQYYRGRWLSPPPWHFPFVMTLMVLPLATTVLAAIGTLYFFKPVRNHDLGWLLILGALVPLVILATGKTQVFDNERLLMPAFPFISALAGIGFSLADSVARKMARNWGREKLGKYLTLGLIAILFLPHTVISLGLYPHLLSYYSEAVGGLAGAKRLRMETTYWAETYHSMLPYLNQQAPQAALVWAEAVDVMLYYQKLGWLREDLRIGADNGDQSIVKGWQGLRFSVDEADLVVVEYRESGFTNRILELVQNQRPVYQLSYRQIPLAGVFLISSSPR